MWVATYVTTSAIPHCCQAQSIVIILAIVPHHL